MANEATAAGVIDITSKKNKKLNLHDVGKLQEVRDLGYRVDENGGKFSATRGTEDHDDWEFIGPCDSAAALITKVKLEGKPPQFADDSIETEDLPDGFVELDSDHKGDRYLPGAAPIVNKKLTDAVLKYHAVKMERVAMTAQETAAKAEMIMVAKMHEDLYVTDPKKPKTKVYQAGDVISRMKIIEDEEFTTEEIKHDD